MLLGSIYALTFLFPLSDRLEGEPRRVVGQDTSDVACAQIPQGAFVPGEAGAAGQAGDRWRTVTHTLVLGDRKVPLELHAITEGGVEFADSLWVDVDANGVESEGERILIELDPTTPWMFVPLDSLGVPIELMVYPHAGEFRSTARTLYHFELDLVANGRAVRAYFLDFDLDERPSAGDEWFVLDERQREFASLPGMMFSANLTSEPWYVGADALRPVFEPVFEPMLEGEGDVLRFTFGLEERPRHEFLAARAARVNVERFATYDQERAAFLEQFDIDPDRPVDSDPPAWYYAWDLDEARRVAEETGRPLYVEFGTDGCPWCKRYDWLNYRDAEITPFLRRFTLVKINADLDPDQTAPGLGLDGVPCHVLFDEGGNALHTFSGWTPPAAYVEVLEEAWQSWESSLASEGEAVAAD